MGGGKRTKFHRKTCEICGAIIEGTVGIDFQIVTHGRSEDYYHQKCIDRVWKGVTDVQGQDTDKRQQILGSG